jgi:hypothetical protein
LKIKLDSLFCDTFSCVCTKYTQPQYQLNNQNETRILDQMGKGGIYQKFGEVTPKNEKCPFLVKHFFDR